MVLDKKTALILDFGGVISRTLFETHEMSERALGLPKGTLQWFGPFAPESDQLWQEMQRNEISERDYWLSRTKEVGKLAGQNWVKMEDFVKAARGARPLEIIRPEFLNLLDHLKEKPVKLAILSNELDLFYGADFREKLPFLNHFEVIIDATYTGVLKPDKLAYLSVLEALNVKTENCVFVDDQLKNINGARALGIDTVHFDVKNPKHSYAQTLAYFE